MESKNQTTKSRILQFIDYQNITKQKFYDKTGLKRGVLDGDKLHTAISDTYIAKIIAIYPQLNLDWLLTGRGAMIQEDIQRQHNNLPLITIDAMAGWGQGDVQVLSHQTKKYLIPEFSELKADFMITVKGDSMYPHYHTGDIVACKKLPLDTFFQWNKVYVLDTVQGAMIKRVKKSGTEGHIQCISENEAYEPFDLPLEDIHALAIVLGFIRME